VPQCEGQCRHSGRGIVQPLRVFSGTKRTRGSNSQLQIPDNLYLADANADGISDFVQFSSNRIFVSQTNYQKTGILHLYLSRPIQRLITGDFNGDGYDNVCSINDQNALQCFGISTDRTALWWWFTQGSFVGSNEDSIVGDFNGDGKDDVLVYNRGNGQLRMYTRLASGFFGLMPQFSLGNLTPEQVTNIQWRAGDFNGDGRMDLMAVQPNGQIVYYASVFDGTNNTFWWAFTTNGGIVGSGDQVSVAKIDNDNNDDIVIHNVAAGTNRFLQMQFNGGNPPPITNVSQGQISTYGNTGLYWGYMHGQLNEPGSQRDDAMVFLNTWKMFVRSDARWDGSQLTYWWAYTQWAPNNDAGWSAMQQNRWLILLCKYADQPAEPHAPSYYGQLFNETGGGSLGMYDYFRDISYGTVDLDGTEIHGWYTMTRTLAQAQADQRNHTYSRWNEIQYCINTATDVNSGNYYSVVAAMNAPIDGGNAGGGGGHVLTDPNGLFPDFLGHEMLHVYGLPHSFGPTPGNPNTEYGDPWDIMSAMSTYTFVGTYPSPYGGFGGSGPNLNMAYKNNRLNWIPSNRMTTVASGSHTSQVVTLAASSKPEANGSLMARINLPHPSTDTFPSFYSVEYRTNDNWDRAFSRNGVFVHLSRADGTSLVEQTAGSSPHEDFQAGDSFTDSANGVTITVNSFNASEGTATVTINY
jgi:hypothetical protein